LHTLVKVGGGVYVVDGKRFAFNFSHFMRELNRKNSKNLIGLIFLGKSGYKSKEIIMPIIGAPRVAWIT